MNEEYVRVTVQEYGYSVLGVRHSPGYTPPVLTRKEKRQRWWRNIKYELGRRLSAKANDLGYYEDCDCDY